MVSNRVQDVLARSPFPKTEVSITETHRVLSRYGDNQITQNVDQEKIIVSIRAISPDGRRQARVDCDEMDTASIDRAYGRLRQILDVLPEAEEPPALHAPGDTYAKPERKPFHLPSPEVASAAIAKAVTRARAQGLNASGILSAERQRTALGSTEGLFLSDEIGDCEFTCTMDGQGGSGRGFSYTPLPEGLAIDRVIEQALEKCQASANPQAVEAGAYEIVMEPDAFAQLLVFYGWIGLSAKAYLENRIFCRQKLGQKILDERVSLYDDPLHHRLQGGYFDGQGAAKKRVQFIDRGVLKELASDDRTARKLGRATTGHGTPEPSFQDPIPWNLGLEFAGPQLSRDEQIKQVKKGILVTQFHYTNVVDLMVPSLTGMTRNGTFLIEDGKITQPIRNLRFTQSLVDLFAQIEAVSPETERVSAFFGGASLAPTVLAKNFNFSSSTEF